MAGAAQAFEYPAGTWYVAMNGRWKRASANDVYSLAVIGVEVDTHLVPDATNWANLLHTLGTPGPL